ncbi:MAG: hypothetical protein A2Z34_00145 [Planctomycetes bacterium RBG_16_59_8]|nr:MAG: hypothetical protein A2Z34_00145 [Planctomycetes bacterium RBG_16_59_8]
MKIAVCVKRVPDTAAKLTVGGDRKSISPEGIEFIINPYDEYAIEEALRIREKSGSGEVIALSVDPTGDQTVMRKVLAMGADRGIVIKGGTNFSGYQTARLLAGAIKELSCDIVFCGKQAVDDDGLQIPAILAHLLGMARVNVVTKLEISGGTATAEREADGGKEIYRVTLPAIFAAQKGLNDPRYPTLKGIMAAKKKTIDVKEAGACETDLEILALDEPTKRPPGRIVGKGVEAVPELVRLLRQEAKVI